MKYSRRSRGLGSGGIDGLSRLSTAPLHGLPVWWVNLPASVRAVAAWEWASADWLRLMNY